MDGKDRLSRSAGGNRAGFGVNASRRRERSDLLAEASNPHERCDMRGAATPDVASLIRATLAMLAVASSKNKNPLNPGG
jgi:hypothetical protein